MSHRKRSDDESAGEGDADLWFLPADDDDADMDHPSRLQQPTSQALHGVFDLADWARAQADLSAELATLCLRFGALVARLTTVESGGHGGRAGVRQRLALREATEMSWWASTHPRKGAISEERLTLWLALRADGNAQEDSLALQEAAWAARRLMSPPRLIAAHGPGVAEFQRFLGDADMQGDDPAGAAGQMTGARLLPASDAVHDLAELMARAQYLHPVTQSAVLFHAWRSLGQGAAVQMEAAVMAACLGGHMTTKTGTKQPNRDYFLPLTLGAGAALRGSGSVVNRLAQWIQGASQATLWALHHLDRLQTWQVNAHACVADLSGRTPQLLVAVLAAWPIVTAPLAQAQTGASRAAVQRNLDLMQRMGLIREITGQGRYRVWTAKI